ncbi:uncharacterized protein METZ01_LOCUS369825, partial [marine metagenome]
GGANRTLDRVTVGIGCVGRPGPSRPCGGAPAAGSPDDPDAAGERSHKCDGAIQRRPRRSTRGRRGGLGAPASRPGDRGGFTTAPAAPVGAGCDGLSDHPRVAGRFDV